MNKNTSEINLSERTIKSTVFIFVLFSHLSLKSYFFKKVLYLH